MTEVTLTVAVMWFVYRRRRAWSLPREVRLNTQSGCSQTLKMRTATIWDNLHMKNTSLCCLLSVASQPEVRGCVHFYLSVALT